MNILAYHVREDEIDSFNKISTHYNQKVTLLKEEFSSKTARKAQGYDAISIVGNCLADKKALQIISKMGVKHVATRTTGYDNIDLEAAKKYRIKITNVPAYSPNSVSEFVIMLTLTLVRNFNQITENVNKFNFSLSGLLGSELKNKTIGIIGTGRIGLEVVKAFSGFGSTILGYDIYENEKAKRFMNYVSLDQLFKKSDIITLHCPLTEENYHLINSQTIQQMKKGVIIVNAARGALIDSQAIVEALKSGKIGSIAMDVYEHESGLFHYDHTRTEIKDEIFLQLKENPNVIVTPHCGFYTEEAVENMVEQSLINIKNIYETAKCENEIVI